jgi:hypothetical protein
MQQSFARCMIYFTAPSTAPMAIGVEPAIKEIFVSN